MARKSDSKSRADPSRRAKPVNRSSAGRSGKLSLGSILDVPDDAIVVVDRSPFITGFKAGAARKFGYTAQQIIGKKLDLRSPFELNTPVSLAASPPSRPPVRASGW